MNAKTLEKTAPIGHEDLMRQLSWRYATKKFDPAKKIPADQWKTLENALVLSPSSFGLQPWKFLVVTNPSTRQLLKDVSFKQPQITEASHLVVFALKKDVNASDAERFIRRTSELRGVSEESLKDFKRILVDFLKHKTAAGDVNSWAARQVYIALGVFLTSAAVLGIDACPMEGIDPDAYDKILGLNKEGYHALCVATAGYRAQDDVYSELAKVRYSSDEVIGHL